MNRRAAVSRDGYACAIGAGVRVSALEVLAANDVEVMIDRERGYTPTPVISHAILTYNRGRKSGLADGIVITPSHNPPEDGGFKYNPTERRPGRYQRHRAIEKAPMRSSPMDLRGVKRIAFATRA